ncbi:hypothetical protein BCR32DRAFT_326571 [Anaeromyces robustus]|uniref:Nucleotide-diphospho-sugar transferase n=1 Tax=Anaeromyces robustus TaxID=1754192 RepID=A0A1Y1XB96_9FUNG|nr:hypothetical protein BCR32DRAFT_326571 [Anaeromyces robustus]|eukprot:ORX83018.1 hypothetical protein BCR32DRAFT_326571 [Anaeromyces robustus]
MKILIKRRFLIISIILLVFTSLTILSISLKQDSLNDITSNIANDININNVNNTKINKFIQNLDINNDDVINCISECSKKSNESDNKKINAVLEKILLESAKKPNIVEDFINLRIKEEAHTALWNIVFGKNNSENKKTLIEESSFLLQDLNELTGVKKILAALHQSLYPWVYHHHFSSLGDIIKSGNGKGIVMCVGNYHFRFARSAIDTLRYVVKTELPIEIFYNGEDDLSEEKRDILSKFPNIYLTDISTYFDNDVINLGGWAIKPFSILASRFEEVILMDADAVYIHDPAILFEDEGYIEKGTVFFRDRTLFSGSHPGSKWLKSWMVDPLPETKELRYWKEETSHEMESSTVVINKPKTILGLLTVCKLNEQKVRDDVVYKYVHGDKETFWIGFDMARQPYNMLPLPSVMVGELAVGEAGDDPDERQICGHVGHMSRDGKILFWNDHILKDKNDPKYENQLLRFEVYFIEDGEGEWPTFHCQNLNIEDKGKGNESGKEPTKFSKEERKILDEIINREKENHYLLPEKKSDKRKNKMLNL